MPSHTTITSPTIHPSIACGPPSAVISSGIVMNGPIPIMLIMLSAVAWSRPKRRVRDGEVTSESKPRQTLSGDQEAGSFEQKIKKQGVVFTKKRNLLVS